MDRCFGAQMVAGSDSVSFAVRTSIDRLLTELFFCVYGGSVRVLMRTMYGSQVGCTRVDVSTGFSQISWLGRYENV